MIVVPNSHRTGWTTISAGLRSLGGSLSWVQPRTEHIVLQADTEKLLLHSGRKLCNGTMLHCSRCMAVLRSQRWRSIRPLVILHHRSDAPPPAKLRVSGDPLLLPRVACQNSGTPPPSRCLIYRKPAAPPPAAGFFILRYDQAVLVGSYLFKASWSRQQGQHGLLETFRTECSCSGSMQLSRGSDRLRVVRRRPAPCKAQV